MPILKRADAEIHYEEYGTGYPVLLFAPGGMRSQAAMWHSPAGGPPRVWNDWTEVLPGRRLSLDRDGSAQCRQVEGRHRRASRMAGRPMPPINSR